MQVENGMPLELMREPLPSPCSTLSRACVVDFLDAIVGHVQLYALRFMSCLLAAEAAVAFHKCHFRVRHFGRVYAFPVYKHTSL